MKINEQKNKLSDECLNLLRGKGYLEEEDILELYLQGKIDIKYLQDAKIEMDIQYINSEFAQSDEQSDERKGRLAILYRKTMLEGKTEKEIKENKESIFDEYFENFDVRYLETFFTLGALEIKDLEGLMSGANWIEFLEKGEISEKFFEILKQNNLVQSEEIIGNEQLLIKFLMDWETGKCSSDQIKELQISVDDLLRLCDEGKIKGTKINEIINDYEENYRRKITTAYSCGVYETISPAVILYNSGLINRDIMINICKGMKVKSDDIFEICKQGLLNGFKIAELRYQGLLTKKQFSDLKQNGFVSEEQEIEAIKNLTPEEMLQELEANGCKKIENMDEILAEIKRTEGTKKRSKLENPTIRSSANFRNPLKIYEILDSLGLDCIVTTNENGFKGYQAFLIPKLGIAVLEKLFRVNRKGELKPSYEEATYICEIEKYIQVSGQTKQEIRNFMDFKGNSNGNVRIVAHFDTWGKNLLKAITEVNPEVEIRREKGEVVSISREGTELDIDVKKLNELVTYMAQGKYTLSLEEYE